ncbi:MAG TPA: archaetidylserine decarboxylase, partial [Gemmatimonadaceae bacterium]|nr:archaetidylserine decarboxylase [Gemmatimonadaceae bacterium]
ERPLQEYRTINELFVRRLKPGLRSWPAGDTVVASPVDGVVGQSGVIADGRLIQAKGRHYSAGALLDDDAEGARYQAGHFVTIYLSPRHYHRIHTPLPGEIRAARHVPGALLPVNEAAVLHVESLFATNERLITYVDGALGRVAVVAVGAYNVGRISAVFDPGWSGTPGAAVTNRRHAVAETRHYDPPKRVDAGGEVMVFHLGSTVVLLFQPGSVELDALLVPGAEVRVGQPIARGGS